MEDSSCCDSDNFGSSCDENESEETYKVIRSNEIDIKMSKFQEKN